MKFIKIICVTLLLGIMTFFLFQKNSKKEIFVKAEKTFELTQIKKIENTNMLNLEEDQDPYFGRNTVEASGILSVSTTDIKVNNRMFFDLKELFETGAYPNIIIRRGFLGEEESKNQGVDDHKTGYDIDIYLKGHEWTDFIGYEEADTFLKNSYQYGLVLRYPNKKEYQPWHYRYVGKEHAKMIHDHHLTLEEYLKQLTKLEENQVYQLNDTTYLYKISSKEILIPVSFPYSVSSIDASSMIVTVYTDKTVAISEEKKDYELEEKNLKDLSISYDLSLVNHQYSVPENMGEGLVSLTKYLTEDNNPDYQLEENVLKSLQPMLEIANGLDRHTTYLTSAYRTKEDQEELYESGDPSLVQVPDHSEHQTGLAFDMANSYKPNTGFTETLQGFWVKEHAHEYGFILRYPSEKEDITKISNEQWHFRYVGKLHATIIKENNLVLEEYLEMWKPNTYYSVSADGTDYIFYKTIATENKISVLKGTKEIYYLKDGEYLIVLKKGEL